MANHYWPTLKEVYISRNMIQSLDLLNDYRSLKIIDASHNFISEVSL
jgi:Leucine-rich repeat (LRR) protein